MRASSVTPDTAGASETMFRAVSAAVIGGTLLAGGEGTAIGALFGALFLGVLRDGLTLQGVNADYLDFILGVAILLAMVDQHLRRPRAEGERPCLSITQASRPAPATTSCASRTSPSASGPVTALRDINLHLRKGEVLGLLGDNGAGKSTLIKIISGFQKPDEGSMFAHGRGDRAASRVDHARSLGDRLRLSGPRAGQRADVFQNMFLRREKVHKPIPFLANRR